MGSEHKNPSRRDLFIVLLAATGYIAADAGEKALRSQHPELSDFKIFPSPDVELIAEQTILNTTVGVVNEVEAPGYLQRLKSFALTRREVFELTLANVGFFIVNATRLGFYNKKSDL